MPAPLLALDAHDLHRELPGPTLFHLSGERPEPVFLSVLQHGNETTGWEAVREWLLGRSTPLPRSLLLFVANPLAAKDRSRRAEGQPDFNRCWPGTEDVDLEVARILAEVTDYARRAEPFASVDIHNNSGRNPHYGATTRNRPEWLYLARLFDRRAVFFQQPKGVQCEAFSQFCPSITVECGLAGLSEGIPHCVEYIDQVMNLDALPGAGDNDLELFHTVARVTVAPELEFGFGKRDEHQVHFRIDLDALNFVPLPAGTPLAEGGLGPLQSMITARDDQGRDLTDQYFEVRDGALRTRKDFVPSMLSRRPEIVRQDCLCYVMEQMKTPR